MALDQLGPGDWETFEKLASVFLSSEYPALRTMASPSGDGGRDATLFCEEGDDSLAFQYSVTEKWSPKIRTTIRRLKESFPNTSSLIYVTNQPIGAEADQIKADLRREKYFLDVYDRSWFIERANSTFSRESAAEELSKQFVDPLVSERLLDNDLVSSLKADEAKTALIFLEMQMQDSQAGYGLTKSSYDALVRASLRATSTANRKSRAHIYKDVHSFLPSHSEVLVRQRVDAALNRLSGTAVRHRRDGDEFHLTDTERTRVAGSISALAGMKDDFDSDLLSQLVTLKTITIQNSGAFSKAARNIVETYFLKKGEQFAKSAVFSEDHKFDEVTLKEIVIGKSTLNFGFSGENKIIVMADVLQSVLNSPTEKTAAYLKSLLESYTLFAFLAATPDVQKATMQMFGSGEIWLDTSVILPLFAETGAPPSQTSFTQIYRQCISAGLKLLVTAGVLEELERHINKCLTFIRSDSWNGPVPYLLASYLRFGGKEGHFAAWVETFVGKNDPVQDIADYLRADHSIRLEVADDHTNVSEELARAVETEWQNIHVERRAKMSGDTTHALRLASHDSETFLHVLSSRIGQRGRAPLGYSNWWLTLDRSARSLLSRIEPDLVPKINTGPVISLDFLLRYLAFGPNREKVDLTGAGLAKIYADALIEPLPAEMIEALEAIRADNHDVPEAIVQRRIRDHLNDERSKTNALDTLPLDDILDAIRDSY
ncbi:MULTISPECIES: hypothetical protein [unclassified Novosphingobium]|uniref:hypothetical protein n=1 Tax=unclassified Novosphingobium TaxID=2644732 RepID=UPI00135B28EF|nr:MULTISPECIES: hypothetical protein [unclassified Novosphingobium]